MSSSWIKIYTSNEFIRSEMVRQVLTENGIDAVLMNKQDSSYKIGTVEVYIHPQNFDKAIEIIIQNEL
ncbi:putative signal transducing protein [Pseudopedobacter beijingensis]|uniref:Signal transducing protein n=1 Tax=Pseudopedobacter beijingensis TaxID=1207056 RepID=A0ABW4I8W3_9SPHI